VYCVQILINFKITNWKKRLENRVDWKKSIKEVMIFIGLQRQLRRRRKRRRKIRRRRRRRRKKKKKK
jgi:hypothetical protein